MTESRTLKNRKTGGRETHDSLSEFPEVTTGVPKVYSRATHLFSQITAVKACTVVKRSYAFIGLVIPFIVSFVTVEQCRTIFRQCNIPHHANDKEIKGRE